VCKGPFIATQLHSTRRRVELRRYRHPYRRNSTVADDRQCNWPSWTAYSQSARSRSVVFLFIEGFYRYFIWTGMLFSIILLTFLQILHSKIPSPSKLVKTRHIWCHDLQTESTGSQRSELIGDSCSRCERVDNSTSSWVELVVINGPLELFFWLSSQW